MFGHLDEMMDLPGRQLERPVIAVKHRGGIEMTGQFDTQVSTVNQYEAAIKADQAESSKSGVDGTPSFVIGNGNPPIIGGAPLQQFSKLIDAQKK
jgi:protein-disulfide isomerase